MNNHRSGNPGVLVCLKGLVISLLGFSVICAPALSRPDSSTLAPSTKVNKLFNGPAGAELATKVAERDAEVELALKKVADGKIDIAVRIRSAEFLNEYLACKKEGPQQLAPVIAALLKEARDTKDLILAGKLPPRAPDVPMEQPFIDRVKLISQFELPSALDAMLELMKDGGGDIYSAHISNVMAERFTEAWQPELMDKSCVMKLRSYQAGLLTDESIRDGIMGKNELETIFNNVASVWGETRNPDMIDLYIRVIEQNRWKALTVRAAGAIKHSWRLYNRWKPEVVRAWVDRLSAIALDGSKDLVQRASAVTSLGGVKEESAGIEALIRIFQTQKRGSYLWTAAMEVLSTYAKRGDLSTMSSVKKISRKQMLFLLKAAAEQLRDEQPRIGVGMQLNKKDPPDIAVVDVAELFGFLLSVILRDGHGRGKGWWEIREDVRDAIAGLCGDDLENKEVIVAFLRGNAIERTPLQKILDEHNALKAAAGPAQAPVKPLHAGNRKREAVAVSGYFESDSEMWKKVFDEYNAHQSFIKGVFCDLSLTKLTGKKLSQDPVASNLADAVKKDFGPFSKDILSIEKSVRKIYRGKKVYGIDTWRDMIATYRKIEKRSPNPIMVNKYAWAVWQTNMAYLSFSALLDEWDVDSPESRPFLRIKLLHSLEILPRRVYKAMFPNTGGVTVDDRWIVMPDTIFKFSGTLPADVMSLGHEAQHWIRGLDDIGMLASAVRYGLDYDLCFLLDAKQTNPRPLKHILAKILKGNALFGREKMLISPDFILGARLAGDRDVTGPKAALLKIFHNFERPVNDWPWGDIVRSRQLLPAEIVTASTPAGKEYTKTNTYREGAKLAGYLMGVSSRIGFLDGWQMFAELLALRPEKYKTEKDHRLNPAEVLFIVEVMGGTAGRVDPEMRKIGEDVLKVVSEAILNKGIEDESDPKLYKRIGQKLQDFIKSSAMRKDLDEESSYEEIAAAAKKTIAALRDELKTEAVRDRLAAAVLTDIEKGRKVPFTSLFDRAAQKKRAEDLVEAQP